jgi:glycosyltransferase involved in cell wall biosynthesis
MKSQIGTTVKDLVSVVIPAYNAAALIEETLQSIFRQTYQPLEVIVVDDGSTDNTVEVVRGFSGPVRLLRQANSGGCSSPRNHGLRFALGEFVTFFDADDLMVPTKIERQVAFLRSHAQCDTVLMDYRNFDEHGEAPSSHFDTCTQLRAAVAAEGHKEIRLASETANRILVSENFAIAGSPLIRRLVFQNVESFDENLRASEDFDLIYRLARHSGLGIIDEIGFLRRFHAANMSNRTEHVLRYKIESRAKLFASERDARNRRLLSRMIANYHLDMADFAHRRTPAKSFRHVWSALSLGYPPDLRVAKGLVKCALSAMRAT